MSKRRQFIISTGSTMAATAMASGGNAADNKPLLSFGLIADCQYADVASSGTRLYRQSAKKLEDAVNELNRHELKFSLHLGDFIDRDFHSFSELKPITNRLKSKLHHTLGNHDFEVEESLRSRVPAALGLATTYYALRHEGFRFLILDTTEVSTYRYRGDDDATANAHRELRALATAGKSYAQPWNSRISDTQVLWLTEQLQDATDAGESVLAFGHHPILPEEAHCSWNCGMLHKLLSRFPCCKAYLNGHRHSGGYESRDGMHYLTLHGMLDTGENSFSWARLYRSHIQITGYGRQPSRTIRFR